MSQNCFWFRTSSFKTKECAQLCRILWISPQSRQKILGRRFAPSDYIHPKNRWVLFWCIYCTKLEPIFKINDNFQYGFFQKINGVAALFFLGVIWWAATLARRKTAGLGVGFPTALFSGGVREKKATIKDYSAVQKEVNLYFKNLFFLKTQRIILIDLLV